ncbi:hypothetical protein E3U23_04505 [Erythrobacter litoralis]|uniref:hypothetical protein n=1 Tax=Erythrobacter litoralis TaxID=39960 RepID=UPI002434F4D8|nr:hypothetical protein [Erythrobacter litoralis]MDG6078452.1 hypothetical protein [Erythrobacter litoralis]
MIATPAAAVSLPVKSGGASESAVVAWSEDDTVQNQYRRWHRPRYRRDRGIDGGDVVAGVLILGGIAAIASAVSKNNRRTRERYPAPPPRPTQQGEYRQTYRSGDGLGNAADMCVEAIGRDRRVENVDQVQRLATGWVVTGTLADGQDFVCTIGQNGRIETIDYAGGEPTQGYSDDDETYYRQREEDYYASRPEDDRQYDDDRYAAERAQIDDEGAPEYRSEGPQPAYPGGPLPGDDDRPVYDYGED